MSKYDELDRIWDAAVTANMCSCGTDNNWQQDIKGYIQCSMCKEWVVKPDDFDEWESRKAVITDYEFELGKGISGILFPDGKFLKCGNAEHHLLVADIPLETQFECIYFSSKMDPEYPGFLSVSPIKFQGITREQRNWMDNHRIYFDEGQLTFPYETWRHI